MLTNHKIYAVVLEDYKAKRNKDGLHKTASERRVAELEKIAAELGELEDFLMHKEAIWGGELLGRGARKLGSWGKSAWKGTTKYPKKWWRTLRQTDALDAAHKRYADLMDAAKGLHSPLPETGLVTTTPNALENVVEGAEHAAAGGATEAVAGGATAAEAAAEAVAGGATAAEAAAEAATGGGGGIIEWAKAHPKAAMAILGGSQVASLGLGIAGLSSAGANSRRIRRQSLGLS